MSTRVSAEKVGNEWHAWSLIKGSTDAEVVSKWIHWAD
jgi:hypothetical protein